MADGPLSHTRLSNIFRGLITILLQPRMYSRNKLTVDNRLYIQYVLLPTFIRQYFTGVQQNFIFIQLSDLFNRGNKDGDASQVSISLYETPGADN